MTSQHSHSSFSSPYFSVVANAIKILSLSEHSEKHLGWILYFPSPANDGLTGHKMLSWISTRLCTFKKGHRIVLEQWTDAWKCAYCRAHSCENREKNLQYFQYFERYTFVFIIISFFNQPLNINAKSSHTSTKNTS